MGADWRTTPAFPGRTFAVSGVFALLLAVGYYAFIIIGQAFFVPSDAASTGLFLLKVLGSGLVVAALLAFAGWRNRGHTIQKSFFVRLIELMVFFFLTGALGFALEFNMGNMFTQKWEFYAISLSLFLVLGFPGFVYRYLMRHPKPRKPSKSTSSVA